MTTLLICDVGTTGLRAAIVDGDATIRHIEYRSFPPSTPFDGLVEFDATELSRVMLDAARTAMASTTSEPVTAIGITNQRASTIVWDRDTGEPIGPALGWQDLRTVNECIAAKAEHGLALAPNQSATKVAWLISNTPGATDRDLCFGTVDSWLLWVLTGGAVHATDRTNAGVTGLVTPDGSAWDPEVCEALGVPGDILPTIVDTTGDVIAEASILDGTPPITSLCGDQQASMVGQGCVSPGLAKITFGTGGMLDMCTDGAPDHAHRGEHGTFPIVGWSRGGVTRWAREAIMLAAGNNVEWLRDDLALIDSVESSADVAAQCETSDGVVYVPAMLGLGTPKWDYGARGTLLGITRGVKAPQIVRAVLEGVAHRGADLVEAAEGDAGLSIPVVRVDGGMSTNREFVIALANATQRPVEVSPVVEATTLGAAYLAGIGIGVWSGMDDVTASWGPAATVEPARVLDREQWRRAVERAAEWIPELSALTFA